MFLENLTSLLASSPFSFLFEGIAPAIYNALKVWFKWNIYDILQANWQHFDNHVIWYSKGRKGVTCVVVIITDFEALKDSHHYTHTFSLSSMMVIYSLNFFSFCVQGFESYRKSVTVDWIISIDGTQKSRPAWKSWGNTGEI